MMNGDPSIMPHALSEALDHGDDIGHLTECLQRLVINHWQANLTDSRTITSQIAYPSRQRASHAFDAIASP